MPKWYVYSTVTMGPRKIGYDRCENRTCFRTETIDQKFSKCSKWFVVDVSHGAAAMLMLLARLTLRI